MGYSLAAVADDWSTLYYNPAGLARLESAQSACVYEFFRGETRSSASLRNLRLDANPDPSRGDFIDPIGNEPASFSARHVGAALSLKLGKLDALFRKTRTGSLPYHLNSEQKTWAYGAGLDLGLLWQPLPRWSAGFVWRFPALIVRDGTTDLRNSLSGLDISRETRVEEWVPPRATVGTAFRTSAGTIASLSVTWHNWSAYDRRTEYDDPVPGLLEDSSGNLFQWQDSLTVNLGGEVRVQEDWFLRGWLVWDQAPEPQAYRTLAGGQAQWDPCFLSLHFQ